LPELTLVIRGGTVVGPAGLTRSDVAVAGTEADVPFSSSLENANQAVGEAEALRHDPDNIG